jgi:hypothetical protein
MHLVETYNLFSLDSLLILPADNQREKVEKDRHQELSKQFSTLVLIVSQVLTLPVNNA